MLDELSSDVQETIMDLHPELIEENIKVQIDAGIESPYKVNYLKEYIYQYKYLKEQFEEDDNTAAIHTINDCLDKTLRLVIDRISDKFEFTIDLEDVKLKPIAKALYKFFIMNYQENLCEFIFNFIIKNKKEIITILKQNKCKNKKGKNVTTLTNKMLYGTNESLIMSNINFIVFNIIPNWELDENFLEYLNGNSLTLNRIKDLMLTSGIVNFEENLFEKFIEPLIDKETGYGNIISQVTVDLSNLYNKKVEKINVFEEDEVNE